MTEREYIRLWNRIHLDFRRKMDALETVWRMSNDSPPPKPEKKKKPDIVAEAGTSNGDRGQLVTAVREAVEALGDRFSTKDVERWIAENRRDVQPVLSSITHSLKRMANLTVAQRGRGKRASIFAKAS